MEEKVTDIQQLKDQVRDLTEKVCDVHYALIGNALAKDGGLIQRVIDCEKEAETLHDRIDSIERKNIKGELYLKWIWGLGSAVAMSIFLEILHYAFKK